MTRCQSLLFASLLLSAFPAPAAEPKGDTARGDRLLDAYFRRQVKQIAAASLADVRTKADWEKQRPERRRQFLDMLGLWPLPPRTDLKPVVTGKVDSEKFTVEKLHFQSLPGLYVTGNLYVPKKLDGPAAAVLYVCGHANTVVDKVSYGSKVNYQYHPAWFASHGYVCLILDTLQLAEIEGIHHGLHRFNLWWWQSRGYTPAGIECWNAMRALDYLETRKEVDAKRIGVTGRSGGGATSWWLAAADDRPRAIVPVAGLADLEAHVVESAAPRYKQGVITGHCDCMYFVNTYRWDFDAVIALCAPRPLLLGNSDADDIFPVPGYRRPAEKARRVYELLGAGDQFALMETKGPHKDTPELRQGAFAWMNRWLKNDKGAVELPEYKPFTPQQLKVFGRLPADAINATIHEHLIRPAVLKLPDTNEKVREWWPKESKRLKEELAGKVFRGWPAEAPELKAKLAEEVKHGGLRLRAYDFVSEEEVPLRLWLLTAEKVEKPKLVVLSAVDEAGWEEFTRELGPPFQNALQLPGPPKLDEAKVEQTRRLLEKEGWAFATLAPRGVGPTRWSEKDEQGRPIGQHIKRRFGLIGQTLDGQRVWDVRRGLAVLRTVADLKGAPLWLQGKGHMAGVVLYAALFEPDVARLELRHPPPSHRQGPTFLNVLRVLDVPQAVALALPRLVRLQFRGDEEAGPWLWPARVSKALGLKSLTFRVAGE